MKYVYIDHSELVELKRPTKRDKEALEYVLGEKDQKILLSWWHIIEAAGCTDTKEAISLVEFIESLKPHWSRDRIVIQKIEVEVEFYKQIYSYAVECQPIYQSFLQIVAEWGIPCMCHTPSYFIRGLTRNRALMQPIEDARSQDLNVSKFVKEAQAKGMITKEVEKEILQRRIYALLPTHSPYGSFVLPTEKDTFIKKVNLGDLDKYPSICTDILFSTFKRLDPRRGAKRTDTADRQHLVPGLTYANVFITRDGYLLDGARYVKKKACRPVADIYDSLASFAEAE